MSIHSRNPSELDVTPLADIIPVFIDYFRNDFDIEDVEDELKQFFSPVAFSYIKKVDKRDAQIFHLMWVLQNMSDKDITRFLEIIKLDYDWIVHKIREEMNSHSCDTTHYLVTLKSMQNNYRKHTLYNVHRTEEFLNLRRALRSLNAHKGQNSVVLLGGLSCGKKWLAIDVCSDFGVLKCMNFKIIWIDCSKCTNQLEDYNCLKIIMTQLNPNFDFDKDGYTNYNFYLLKEQIKREFKSKENNNSLLVLANVQNTKCLDAFNLECKRLIITRNRKVSDSLSERINKHIILNNGLTREEFYLLLDKYKKGSGYDWRKDNLQLANDIYDMSLGEPCSLRIIAKLISKKKSNWEKCMENINNFEISDKKLQLEIAKSLEILNTNELKLFATFAIFPRCAQIPVKLLAYLWNLQLSDAEDFIEKLNNYFFVQERLLEDNETIVCCVKFMYSSYINNCPKIQKLINHEDLHTKIVKYYQVEDQLNSRKDVDLDVDSYDDYFYRWIAYHLYHSTTKHLLAKLYTDFGFLGQKMRALDANDIMADINKYKIEIANVDNRKFSLTKFNNFLGKTEEKITMYEDCCLLQYALFSSENFIRELALKQIEKFPQRLWFTERGQYQQWRFIFKLSQIAKIIRILDKELCLVVSTDHCVYLTDLKLGSCCNKITLISDIYIKDIQIFDDKNHVLTLDKYGSMKLWDISEEKQRILNQRTNIGKLVSQLSFKPNRLYHKQSLNDFLTSNEKIQTFYLKSISQYSTYSILVALNNGLLKIFDWNDKTKRFQHTQIPHPLKIKNINNICIINNSHYMIIYYTENNNLDIIFLKLRNTEQENIKFTLPENEKLLYRKVYDHCVLLVFEHVVIQMKLTFEPFKGHLEKLYETSNCAINCAKLLLDNKYLMLGTEKGIKILDLVKRTEILQSIVSENISSLDNYDLDDAEFKSMIVCGCNNKNILYIFGLRLANGQSLVWEHSTAHKTTEELSTSEVVCARFIGDKLFAVCENNDCLYAVDAENKIHRISCNDNKIRTILPPLHVNSHIVGISCFDNSLIVAYDNGEIYDYFGKRLLVNTNERISTELFLKNIDNNILVTSWPSLPDDSTCIKHMKIEREEKIATQTKYCKMVMDSHLLIVNIYGAAVIYNRESNSVTSNLRLLIKPSNSLASCDLKNNVLFLGFSAYEVHIYSLEKKEDGSIDYVKRPGIPKAISTSITCLTANHKADLLAVAIDTTEDNVSRTPGNIEIFKLNNDYKPQLIYILKSHIKPINDLRFSPQNDVLVSVGERICFWNINYILNNPLDVGNKKRHSSRFTSQKSTEEVDFKMNCQQQQRRERFLNINSIVCQSKVITNANNTLEQSISSDDLMEDNVFGSSIDKIEETNNWCGLMGPTNKPELLSCIKLDGNEAKQIFTHKNFTQFSTIDDEGVYYNLERLQVSLPEEINSDDIDITDSSESSVIYDNSHDISHRLSIASSIMSGADVVDAANTT